MSAPEPKDPLATAEGLQAALAAMAGELQRVRQGERRNRAFVIFDIALTVLLTLVGGVAVHSATVASQADKAQLALCQAGNVARAQQLGLWDYLFHLAGKPPTSQARKLDAEFLHHVHTVFMPRNCSKLGQPGGPATTITPRGTR